MKLHYCWDRAGCLFFENITHWGFGCLPSYVCLAYLAYVFLSFTIISALSFCYIFIMSSYTKYTKTKKCHIIHNWEIKNWIPKFGIGLHTFPGSCDIAFMLLLRRMMAAKTAASECTCVLLCAYLLYYILTLLWTFTSDISAH